MIVSSICRIIVVFLAIYFVLYSLKTNASDAVVGAAIVLMFVTLARAAHASQVEQQLKQLIKKDKEPEFDETDYTDEWNL